MARFQAQRTSSRCAGGDGPHLPTALQLTGTVTHPAGKAALAGELMGFVCPRRPVLPAWPKPGGPVSPAPMESVDRWPLASITAQIPGGRPSVVAAVRRRDRGRLPSFRGADAAAGPGPVMGAGSGRLRADRPWRTQWGQLEWSRGPRGTSAGVVVAGRMSPLPTLTNLCPSGGLVSRGGAWSFTGPASPRGYQGGYLVDSASSHMLVSKIKPCMSKYKQSIR
ncbi:hypothetical protein DTO271G3_7692 [Paecilomyces variotii]|nr:hypothetical protein DTO271G3_7692 [Paecilomyces variotii]